MCWKLQSISGFRREFDVPCWTKLLLALSCWEVRKNVFNHALLRPRVSRKSKPRLIVALRIAEMVQLKASIALLRASCLIYTCKKLVGLISCNSPIQARRHSVSPRHFLQFIVLDWKHFSSRAQWSTLSRMEHQTLNENLESTEVSNACHCHIYDLLLYYKFPVFWEEIFEIGPGQKFFGCKSQVFVENNASKASNRKSLPLMPLSTKP